MYKTDTGNTKEKCYARNEIFGFLCGKDFCDFNDSKSNWEFIKKSNKKLLSITQLAELEYHGEGIFNKNVFSNAWIHPEQYIGCNIDKKEISDITQWGFIENWPVIKQNYYKGNFIHVLWFCLSQMKMNVFAGNIDLCSEPKKGAEITSSAMKVFEEFSEEKNRIAVTITLDNPWNRRRKRKEFQSQDFIKRLNSIYPDWQQNWKIAQTPYFYKNKKSKLAIFFFEKI